MKSKQSKGKRAKSSQSTNKDKAHALNLDVIAASATPNVWGQPPVDMQPHKWVSSWAVYRATPKDGMPSEYFDLHFVGRDDIEGGGCVSSRIMSFDAKTRRGTTRSGRIYQLAGLPVYCPDAEYVLQHWANFQGVDVADATDEFLDTYGLTREELDNVKK